MASSPIRMELRLCRSSHVFVPPPAVRADCHPPMQFDHNTALLEANGPIKFNNKEQLLCVVVYSNVSFFPLIAFIIVCNCGDNKLAPDI
jgi:hypothetical protein